MHRAGATAAGTYCVQELDVISVITPQPCGVGPALALAGEMGSGRRHPAHGHPKLGFNPGPDSGLQTLTAALCESPSPPPCLAVRAARIWRGALHIPAKLRYTELPPCTRCWAGATDADQPDAALPLGGVGGSVGENLRPSHTDNPVIAHYLITGNHGII